MGVKGAILGTAAMGALKGVGEAFGVKVKLPTRKAKKLPGRTKGGRRK